MCTACVPWEVWSKPRRSVWPPSRHQISVARPASPVACGSTPPPGPLPPVACAPGKPLVASAALCAATLLPARAEIDVARLKTAIEVSVEGDYPKLDALYKDIH